MEKDSLITLDDNTEYALIDETTLDNKKYFFAIKVDNTTKEPTDEYEIFIEEKDNNDIYMDIITDDTLKESLMVEFTNNYMNMIKDLKEDE